MQLSEFKITKLVKETKNDILLLGNSNIDLLKIDENSDSGNFLDMFSNFFMPHITSPTRISPRSKILAQFLILPNRKLQKVTTTVIYQRYRTKMDKKSFLKDLRNLNWETALSIAKKDVNHSSRKFLNIIETLLDTYAPLSPLSEANQKRKLKPWITKRTL